MTTNTSTDPDRAFRHAEKNRALDTLREVAARREQIEQDAQAAVQAARSAGVSWSRIGTALGVTAQAAHKRYHQD